MARLCEIAGVSRAGYYKWLKHEPSAREIENRQILEELRSVHLEVKGIYGYRRMGMNLRRRFDRHINHKRVYRLMEAGGLRCVIRRRKKKYVYSTPQQTAENLLNREFRADRPNEKWLTDVTEFKYGSSGKCYLSAILDLYDGSIRSFVIGHSNNNTLVFQTLYQALQGNPGAKPLLHSDRGFQYTSKIFGQMTKEAGITQSMSRVGRCIDNGPMEAFFGALKCESYRLRKYRTYDDLSESVTEYIRFYNQDRYQERLNGLSPLEFRAEAV